MMMPTKFALIIGATGSIGQATAEDLAAKGYSLYLHYHQSQERANALLTKLTEEYPSQWFYTKRFDLSSVTFEELSFIFELDAIVFAQGRTVYKEIESTSQQEIQDLFNQYVYGPIHILQLLKPKLTGGSVVFLGSVFGEIGASWEAAYSSAKSAQSGFMKSLAKEWAGIPIRVNMVSAGFIQSRIHEHLTSEDMKLTIEEIPLKRMGTASEVAYAIGFLVSEESKYITGQTIAVNGGWHLHD